MSFESFEQSPLTVGLVLEFRTIEHHRDGDQYQKKLSDLEASLRALVTEQLASDTAGADELLMRSPFWRALRHGLEEHDALYTELPALLSTKEEEILEDVQSLITDFVRDYHEGPTG